MNNELTRRAALAALAGAPVSMMVLGIPAAARASEDRTAWDRAFTIYQRAKAAADADSAAFDPLEEAYRASYPSMDSIDFRQLSVFNGFGHDRLHIAYKMDVEQEWQEFLARENKTWWALDPEQNRKTKERRRAALDSVLEFRRKVEEHGRDTSYTQAAERNDRLDEARYNAKWELIRTPAPDGEALLWKLETLFGPDASHDGSVTPWSEEAIAPVMADARRLLSHGRA